MLQNYPEFCNTPFLKISGIKQSIVKYHLNIFMVIGKVGLWKISERVSGRKSCFFRRKFNIPAWPLRIPFFALQKMVQRSRKASLHAATAALHSKGAAFSSHLHQTPEALLVKTLPAPFHYAAARKKRLPPCKHRRCALKTGSPSLLASASKLHGQRS